MVTTDGWKDRTGVTAQPVAAFFLTVSPGRCFKGAEGVAVFSLFCGRLRWVFGHYSLDSCSQTDEGLCQYRFVSRGLVSRVSGPLPHPTKGLGVSLGSTCQCSVHNVRGSCLWFVSFWTSARCPLCYPRCLTITAPPLCLHFCQSDVFSVTFKNFPPMKPYWSDFLFNCWLCESCAR